MQWSLGWRKSPSTWSLRQGAQRDLAATFIARWICSSCGSGRPRHRCAASVHDTRLVRCSVPPTCRRRRSAPSGPRLVWPRQPLLASVWRLSPAASVLALWNYLRRLPLYACRGAGTFNGVSIVLFGVPFFPLLEARMTLKEFKYLFTDSPLSEIYKLN